MYINLFVLINVNWTDPCLFPAPMAIEEQVACIYAGVKGHLDKVDPSKITAAEEDLLHYIRSTQQDLLADIRAKGMISEDADKKLKEVISGFMSTWSGWFSSNNTRDILDTFSIDC